MKELIDLSIEEFAALDDEALALVVDPNLNVQTHKNSITPFDISHIDHQTKEVYVSFVILFISTLFSLFGDLVCVGIRVQ